MKRVLVGLSGGVDSAAVAKILLQEGWEVSACYLSFCKESDPDRAAQVASKLGIPFTVLSRQRRFENRVIRPFVETYCAGRTPNPCVECNRKMKIACLLEEADRLGIPFVATGHYARITQGESGRWELRTARDQKKDQSYFLWKLTQKQLSRLLFPLEGMEKERVRELAEGLVPPKEKESMEICFVPHSDTAAFLESHGGKMPEGDFVSPDGRILGKHKGISHYTPGQRRGLGVSSDQRLFVGEILPQENRVVLVKKEELLTSSFRISDLRFVSVKKSELPKEGIEVKGRHRGVRIPCRPVFENGGATVYLEESTPRFAPGQSACFYCGDKLLFGGMIEK